MLLNVLLVALVAGGAYYVGKGQGRKEMKKPAEESPLNPDGTLKKEPAPVSAGMDGLPIPKLEKRSFSAKSRYARAVEVPSELSFGPDAYRLSADDLSLDFQPKRRR